MSEFTGNIGEWSEVYVFFRILGEHFITACDEKLQSGNQPSFPVTEIRRDESGTTPLTFRFNKSSDEWTIYQGGNYRSQISAAESHSEAISLLQELLSTIRSKKSGTAKTETGKGLSFPKAEKFLRRLHATSIKAKSKSKQDIELTIRDTRAGGDVSCGFSIKSFLSNPPTLLNASAKTVFVYEVEGIQESDIEDINSSKIGLFLHKIQQANGHIKWHSMDEQYRRNLMFIDTAMPQIISEVLLTHFSSCHLKNSEKLRSVRRATRETAKKDPISVSDENLYVYKLQKLLEATALGMIPSEPWNGIEDANGGFIIVKPEGEIVTFHIYNRNAFMKYLYNNTYFEHPDSGRYNIGKIYKENGRYFFGLPLNIRYEKIS